MKIVFLFVIVCVLGVSAQRRGSKLDDANVEAAPKASSNVRSRGRARFTATPEFEQINSDDSSSDTKKFAKRIDTPKKLPENAKIERRVSRPAKEPLKLYEVSETVDDIPREEEMKKIVLAAPRVVTESKFESLNIAKPLPIASSTTEDNAPNYPKSPLTVPEEPQSSESTLVSEATAAVSDVPKITPDLSRKLETTTVKVKPTIKQKVPHRRFNVKAQSTTEKSEETTAGKRKQRVRGQTQPGTVATTAASARKTRKRVEPSADSGPSVVNSERRDLSARSRPGRTIDPTLQRRSDDEDNIYFAGEPLHRDTRSKGRYSSESNSDEGNNESSSRPQNRQRTSSRRKATSPSTTTSTESNYNARKRVRVSSTERSIDSNENTSRGSRRKVSRVIKVESTTAGVVEPRQSRTRSRVKVIKKEPESRLNVVPNSNEKQASQVDDFATSSTKDFEVRMSAEGSVVSPVTSRNSIRVSRQQTISVEAKTEKAIRKVFRKKSGLNNASRQSTSQETPTSSEESIERVTPQSFAKIENRNDGKRKISQTAQRRTIVPSSKQKSGELTSSEEAIGGEENYPLNFIANIKAKKSRKGTGSSSSQSSKDSLTKTIEKGAASAKPSASLEASSPSESAIVESYANNLESSSQRPESNLKPKKLQSRPAFPKRSKSETEKPVATTPSSVVAEPSTASEINQTPLQKYHARFKLNRNQNQKEVIVTSPRPIHKSRSYLPKAPKGIYSSKKLSRSTTVSPVTEAEKLKKINIEASALSTQVPPKGSNTNKATRFSARYRNDILARPGILRTSTSGPPYIPTVPTVTPSPSSVKIEDNLLGLEVISIDDPIINTVPSANLISGDYISAQNTSTPVGSKEDEDQKPISIIERIINSITSISTTTSPDLNNTSITTTTNGQPTTQSAIQKLVSKRSRATLDEDVLHKLTTTSNFKTTEKPTTVIEKILSSLSALRAKQATESGSQQVGGNYNTLAGVSSTESISELADKSSTTLPSTPSLLTSDSSTETPTSTASSSSTVGSTDSSIPSTLLSLNDISTFSLDASSVSSSTLNPNFAIQDLTSDQTLPKRTVDQLLSLFNMNVPTTTDSEASPVVVVTPKLTTFVTSNTITPAPSVTTTDVTTTVVTSRTETDNTTPRVITTSTLISILTTKIDLKDLEKVTVTEKLLTLTPTTETSTTAVGGERTVTVTPVTDSSTTPMSTTNRAFETVSTVATATEPTSTMPTTLTTTVPSSTESSVTYITTQAPQSTTESISTLSPVQTTSSSSETTLAQSTTYNTINDAENFINPLSVNVQNSQSGRIASTLLPEQTTTDQTSTTVPTVILDQTSTTVTTVSPDQTSTTVPTLTTDQISTTVTTVLPDQPSTTVPTLSPDQTSTTVPTLTPDQISTTVPTLSPDQTSTTVSTAVPDQTSTTVSTVVPDGTTTSTLLPDQSTPVTINDAENFINPLSVTEPNFQPEILSIMDLIAQIMDQTKRPSGSRTSTLDPEFEASTINPIFYTTNANFATASENIPVITRFSSPIPDQVVSSTVSTTDLPVQTTNEMSTNLTLTTTPSDTLTTGENTMLDSSSSSNLNTETTTDVSSTIPLLDKFEVSLDRVKVYSANDVSSTLTPDDDVAGTTISIISRNFIPDTNSTSTADENSVKPVNNSLDSTTQDISSNIIDTIEITEKLNGTDVSNLVNPLSSDTNVSVSNNTTSVNNTRAGKLILEEEDPIRDNNIDTAVREKDYYIFAVLQNNTILRKRPSQHPTKETPFIIYGLLPNNTLLRKFLNGTLVPMEPVIQVNGFDTRENPPPITESNNINQVTSDQENQPENISTTTERRIEANELSLNADLNNTQDNSIPKLTELLGKNTVRAFNNIVNQTQGSNQTVQVITLQVDPKIENRLNPEGNTIDLLSSSTTIKSTTTKLTTTRLPSTTEAAQPKTPPVVFTSPLPTTTTRKQTKPTTTTPKRTTTTRPTTTSKIEESNNEIEPNLLAISSRISSTTATVPPTTVTSKPMKDISIEELKKKNLTEQQKKDLATLEALEKEHQSILQQLSFLTKLNFGGLNASQNNISKQVGVKLPVESATQKAKITTTPLPIEQLLKQLNGKGITPPSQVLASTYGKTNDALLASLLKEYGVAPTPPKPLADVLSQITDTTTGFPTTTIGVTKRRIPTTPAPNRFMQGLNWLINTIAPQPTKRPLPKSKSPKSNRLNEENEVLSKQPTEITPTIVEAPTTKSINSGISQEKLHALIKQLEEVKTNPESAKNLDLETLKSLQKLKSKDIKDIQVIASSSNGASTKKFMPTQMPHFLPTASGINLEQDEVSPLVNNRGRPDRATTRDPLGVVGDTTTTVLKLPPVKLNPVKGISDEEPLIQGQLVNYAIDVTKAISSFLGNALQGAATSFQSMIGSGSRTSRNRTMFSSAKRTG